MAGKGKGKRGLRNKANADGLTSQGVSFDKKNALEEYEPGETNIDFEENFYQYTAQQLKFLEEFAKDLDAGRAALDAGYTRAESGTRLLKNPYIQREAEQIMEAWRYNIRMTAEHASGRHIKFLDKLEREFDGADTGDKAKLATSMVRGLDSYLRAAGHFNHGGGGSEAQVSININLGDSKPEDLEVEVIDE